MRGWKIKYAGEGGRKNMRGEGENEGDGLGKKCVGGGRKNMRGVFQKKNMQEGCSKNRNM